MMARMLVDSLAHILQCKYLSTLNNNIEIVTYVLVSAASAFSAEFAFLFIDRKLISGGIFSVDSGVNSGLKEAVVMAPYALVSLLISNNYKYIPFSQRLL